MTFHKPSLLECHKGNHPTTPLSKSMCGDRDDQKSTKSQIAFMRSGFFLFSFLGSLFFPLINHARAEQLTIASASNFIDALKQLSEKFKAKTGHKITIIQGSSGALANQILHGLPVDVFLSADQSRIDKLIKAKAVLSQSRFTYAIGQLTLWSTDKSLIPQQASAGDITTLLSSKKINQIAIANPRLAPYGLAGEQTIQALGVKSALANKTVYGQNIAQTFTITAKGGVQLGFIARAQAQLSPYIKIGSYWHVPATLHEPIKQDGIIIKASNHQISAKQFTQFMKSQTAISIIINTGFKAPN